MVNMPDKFIKGHEEYYSDVRALQNKERIVSPGSQYLIHLLKGGYLGEDLKEGAGRKVLDVGCGSGYNAVSFAKMGWQVSGVEITEDIVAHARKTVRSFGYDPDIKVGENENLPFAKNEFDFLLSLNVIHYVQSEEAAHKTISEYARVLKPGGRIFLSTNHPDNWLLEGAKKIADNLVRVSLQGDYRDGETLFLFRSQDELKDKFATYFEDIQVGKNRFDFFARTLLHWIITAVKPTE